MCQIEESSFGLAELSDIANIAIAFFALLFSLYIFRSDKKRSEEKENIDKNLDSLKTLIYQHNLPTLFLFFDNINEITKPLSLKTQSNSEKQGINEKLQEELKKIRINFIDLLLAIDPKLYNEVKDCLDKLIDDITESMFDEGINLTHMPKYDEVILVKISSSKTDTIKVLHDYDGKDY